MTEIFIPKTGINIKLGGTEGVDWVYERYYFDDILYGKGTIWIKSDVEIQFTHNENNIAGRNHATSDGFIEVGPEVGLIRMKVDGDQAWGKEIPTWPEAIEPFTFDDLNYGYYDEPLTPVVGSTGDNGVPLTAANKLYRFHKGMLDSAGNEWHTLTVTDDDAYIVEDGVIYDRLPINKEFRASDGKIFNFIVNPKTPTIKITSTGGEFYSTPPKKYFIPKIFDQATYIQGSVSIELNDLSGANVLWRIVSDPESGASYANAGSNIKTFTDSDFSNGLSYLQFYRNGSTENVVTRKIFKVPDEISAENYPSYEENHGDMLWGGVDNFNSHMKAKLSNDYWVKKWRDDNNSNNLQTIQDYCRKGKRGRYKSMGKALYNALIARAFGMTYQRKNQTNPITFADAAKLELMELSFAIDPIGIELNTSNNAIPGRDYPRYRGYHDVDQVLDAIGAYDILLGYYRKDQGYPNGISPIEDYWLRDVFAQFVHVCEFSTGKWGDPIWEKGIDEGGMWDTANKVGAVAITCILPSYSTEYYGTSGMDGNGTTYPYDSPFPDVRYTWREIYIDNDIPLTGFPNPHARLGVADPGYNFNENAEFLYKIGYLDTVNMGHVFGIYNMFLKRFFPWKEVPLLNLLREKSLSGPITHLGGDNENSTPRLKDRLFIIWMNNSFPDYWDGAQEMYDLYYNTADDNDAKKQLQRGGAYYSTWAFHQLPDVDAQPQRLPRPAFSLPPGPQETPGLIEITCDAPGVEIYYTLDGEDPTEESLFYTEPIVVESPGFTLKAIAIKEGFESSYIQMATYTFPYAGRPAPVSITKLEPRFSS